MYEEALKLIINYQKIIVIRHKTPDYDAYGSQIGLALSLRNKYPEKIILMDGDENSNNVLSIPMDKVKKEDYKDSLVILTDQSSVKMLNDENFRLADKVIIIDHHESSPDFGDLIIIKPLYSSASEMITEFLSESSIEIPKEAADALYIGMVGDSARFLYRGTSSNTFKMASILIDSGADILEDYKKMSKDESANQKKFKGYVLSNFQTYDKIAYIMIDKKTRDSFSIDTSYASRGSVNLLSGIEGIDAFVDFTESDEGEIYTEIRSKEISVVDVAKAYGGGGHALACGATLSSFKEAEELVKKLNDHVKGEANELL
ncbi:MAG: bifunctional oligoribonuclease/PAP phosphatase NrnA [Bacillales bacterium]|nr:bifunctional oligoribonuclease/PAP phosphatase NrnA [Bacillales bacterium]